MVCSGGVRMRKKDCCDDVVRCLECYAVIALTVSLSSCVSFL